MPDLELKDVTLHYAVSGQGPPLLLIAGFMSDSASWAPLLPLLEADFTCICPDNRTCGQTRPIDAPVSMEHWADDLAALLAHLDGGPVTLVGHSLGGLIGWRLAQKSPELAHGLLMLGSAPIPDLRNMHLWRTVIELRHSPAPPDAWLKSLFPWLFHRRVFEDPAHLTELVAAALAYPHAQSVAAMERQLDAIMSTKAGVFDALPSVSCRALLSRDDLVVDFPRAKASLSGFDVREVDGVAHSMHWDAPDLIAQHIRTFVGDLAT